MVSPNIYNSNSLIAGVCALSKQWCITCTNVSYDKNWSYLVFLSKNARGTSCCRLKLLRQRHTSLHQLWGWRFSPCVGGLVIDRVLWICFTSLRFHVDVTHAYFITYINCSRNLRQYGKYRQSTAAQLSNISLCHIRTRQTISYLFALASGNNMGYRT